MRTSLVAFVLVTGCAKSAPPVAPPPPAPAAPATPARTPAPPAPAPVTCADAGVILRGTVEDQKTAGPEKEASIARACRQDRWGTEVLACVGGKAPAKPCLDQLTFAQRSSYDAHLQLWHEAHPDEYLDDAPGFDTPSYDDYIDCSDVIKAPGSYAPAVTLTGDLRDYVVGLREDALLALCEDWDHDQRACFRDTAGGPVDACRARLDVAQAQAVTDKLTELDKLATKIGALKKNPAAFECKQVVAVHYANATWKGQLVGVKAAERARAIAESRALMTKACVDQKWAPNMRACLVAGGSSGCVPSDQWTRWGRPALGVYPKTGIPECDAVIVALKAADACPALSQPRRDGLAQSWVRTTRDWPTATVERKEGIVNQCRQLDGVIRTVVTRAGCKL